MAAAVSRAEIRDRLLDPSYEPDRSRVRLYDEARRDSDELVSMGDMYVADHGGSLRTFSGNLSHENGCWPSYKRRRNQHWEGMAQRNFLLKAEVDLTVIWAQSEARRFEFVLAGKRRRYTCDIEKRLADGTRAIIEIKRNEADLADEDYQLTLAGVAEICRRCGWLFQIVFSHEIFASRTHRKNVELFQSRRFASVGREHMRRLTQIASCDGPDHTYGGLSAALVPSFAPAGAAIVQALLVRRMIEIDLTQHLYEETPVRIL
ncbi:MAG: hypothetical protein ACXW27_00295 [Allosphingosinicella sp.]